MQRWPGCVPILSDGVVTLRAHREQDLPRIVQTCQDADTQAHLPLPFPYGPDEARAFLSVVREGWESGTKHEWAIEDSSGRYVGSANLHDLSPLRAEVGFAAHPDARDRGLVSRAVRLLLTEAFARGVQVVRWRAYAGNWASRRVAWRCGFGGFSTVAAARLDRHGRPGDEWHAAIGHDQLPWPRTMWWHPSTLQGERIRLRAWRDTDVPREGPDAVAERYNPGVQPGPDDFGEWLAARRLRMAVGEGVFWCIADRETDEAVGHVQLVRIAPSAHPGTGHLGYWLAPAARGRGLLSEALDLLVPHAFADHDEPTGRQGLGLHRIEATVDLRNHASQRVLRRAGLRLIGTRAGSTLSEGGTVDEQIYELLAREDRDAQRVTPLDVPVLETERLRLRPWQVHDAPREDDVVDADAARFVPERGIPTPSSFPLWLERRTRFRDERTALNWCIADRRTDRAMGNITLFTHGDDPIDFDAELGYFLWPWARGRGVLSEAIPPVLEHAFCSRADAGLGLTRVHAGTDEDNHASRAVLRRAGMREWGSDRQSYRRRDGSLSDGAFYEILATDERPERG